MMPRMFAKYFGFGRGSRARGISTISRPSSSSSAMARVWKEEKTSWLVLAFTGGYLGHACINYRKRKANSKEVDRMLQEYYKRADASSKRRRRYFQFDDDA
ncbi:unnamed protein product [Microthlaspi erraticum]|uniref:Uncharacterized protein n=1 Tax=Microthlaspi erraticum TaxID=1685480 RepID=A0A6D2HKB0_9BRAS|nr:unnamed protein product [Microthlaspi erraticum]